MKLTKLFVLVTALVLLVSMLSIWFKSSVKDYMDGNTKWNGVKDFVSSFNVATISSLSALSSDASGKTLIAIPTISYSPDDLARAAQFVNSGGTLVLMDDFGYGNNILQYLKMDVRFANGELLDPLFCYKNQELPRITSFSPALSADSIKAVTFNLGTSLVNIGDGEVLARSSEQSFMDLNNNGTWDDNEQKGPFAVAAKYKMNAGYVEVVSDPSILINSMLHMDDNTAFVRYLTGDTVASGSLYIDRSHFISTPLDSGKFFLIRARKALSSPYAVLGVLALLFILVALNTTGGATIDRHQPSG